MSLLDKLMSVIGLGSSTSEERRDVEITVERESGEAEPDAEVEREVKESVETGEEAGEIEEETEEPEAGTEEPESESDAGEESRVPSEAVDVIKGIGPTYADRLSNAGVETVDDLADADPEALAEEADVPEGRLEGWIEKAQARER